jgi:LacI family transcriptional regulator
MSDQRITSRDVAQLAGVSRTTVSFVLNNVSGMQISEETRQRVLAAAKELGYEPDAAAQALARRRSQTIGLVIIRNPNQVGTDVFLVQMLNGLVSGVHRHQLRLLVDIVQQEHQEQAYLRLVRAKRIDGVILAGPRFDDVALQGLMEQKFPTVLIGELPGVSFASVEVDNRVASRKAVDHLIQLGHTRIGCITNALQQYYPAIERLGGYQDSLLAAGLPYDEARVRYGDFDSESGYQQMKSLLEVSPRVSAMFVASDVVAIGAMAAIHERGLRIPQDIAVVGYDDIPLARYLTPPLTTVHLPVVEIGYQAVDMLAHLIRNEALDVLNRRLESHLVVRESCGASGALKVAGLLEKEVASQSK